MPGGFTRQKYDTCDFQQYVADSTSPYEWVTYRGRYVNGNKCHVPQRSYVDLVTVESELKNQGHRLASKCLMNKYHPACKSRPGRGGKNKCFSTFSRMAPINPEPRVCPDAERALWFNNGLIRPKNPGFVSPNMTLGSTFGNLPRSISRNPYLPMKPKKRTFYSI